MRIIFYVEEVHSDLMINCLRVTAIHSTRDMSVGNTSKVQGFYPYREASTMIGKSITLINKCSSFSIDSISEDEAVLTWNCKQYTVKIGETINTPEYAIENPYLSWEGVSMEIAYEKINVCDKIISVYDDLCKFHIERPSSAKGRYSNERREECLKLIYEQILNGDTALKSIYAWLSASVNWDTLIISDYPKFVEALGDFLTIEENQIECWLSNFAQIITRNRVDDLFKNVGGLKAYIERLRNEGYETAEEILSGKIEYQHI